MLNSLLTRVFGSRNERLLTQLGGIVRKINALEPSVKALSDDELRARTAAFKERVQNAVGDTKPVEQREHIAAAAGLRPRLR